MTVDALAGIGFAAFIIISFLTILVLIAKAKI